MAQLSFTVQADYDKVIKLREEIEKLENTLKNMGSNATPASIKALEQRLGAATAEMGRLVNNAAIAGDEVSIQGKKMANSMDFVGKAIAGAFAIDKISGFINSMIAVRSEFQAADVAIKTLLGSEVKAAKLMGEVREYAKISPLEFSDVTRATQMMIGFNIEAEKVPRYLSAIGDVSMGDKAKFNSLTLAFSQMSAAGKLMGQDLLQMINAGFNPLQTMAEKTGKSIATLKKEMSNGAISAEMVQQAFIDATSAGGKFYKMSENASKTIQGQISMLQDAMAAAYNEMGTLSEGFIIDAIKMGTKLVENYETIGRIIAGLVATYGAYKAAVITTTAVENLQKLGVQALTNAEKIHYAWLVLQEKAQKALNKAMLTNPYVLLAMAVVGLGTAIWALHDRTTSAEKAQKDYNDEQERAAEIEKERSDNIHKLIGVIKDENETEYEKIKAYEELQKLSPYLTEQYNREQLAVLDLAKANKALNEERDKAKQNKLTGDIDNYRKAVEIINNAKDRSKGNSNYVAFNKQELLELSSILGRDTKKWNVDYAQGLLNIAKDGLREYERIKRQAEEDKKSTEQKLSEARESREQIYQEFLSAKETLRQEQEKLKNSPWSVIPIDVQIRFDNAKNQLEEIDKTIAGYLDANQGESYKAAYYKAKKEYENAKKAVEEAKKKSLKEYEAAKTDLAKKEATFKSLGGDTSKIKDDKAKREAEKRKDEEKKLGDALTALKQRNEETETKILEDSLDKQISLIRDNYKKREVELDKQQRDFVEGNKKAGIKGGNDGLTDEQRNTLNKARELMLQELNKETNDLFKQPLEKYQSYTDARLAIEKQFNEDIEKLRRAREEAVNAGNQAEIDKIDRSIAKATADKGKALMQHDYDVFKKSPEYVKAFEDLKNTSTDTLNALLVELEKYKLKASEVLDPTDLREYVNTIQSVMDELDSRDIFGTLAKSRQEFAAAQAKLKQAEKDLKTIQEGGKVVKGYRTSIDANGRRTIVTEYKDEAEAIKEVAEAKDASRKAGNKLTKAEENTHEEIDKLLTSIKGVGDAIGGQAGEVIGFIVDIGTMTNSMIQGIEKVTGAAAASMSAVEKASVILGIISTAVQIIKKIGELGEGKAFKEYEKYAEKLKEINKLTDAMNEYAIAVTEARQAEESWFSEDNLNNIRNFRDVNERTQKSYFDKLYEMQATYRNKGGGGWLTGAINWTMANMAWAIPGNIQGMIGAALGSSTDRWKKIWGQSYDKSQSRAIDNLRMETRKAKSGFLGTGIGGKKQKTEDIQSWIASHKADLRKLGLSDDEMVLFDDKDLINKKLAQTLVDNYGDKLVGQTKETLESLIKLREKYDEYKEQLHEYVSSLYNPLVDNMVDSIWDWFDSGKDALDSFKEYASSTFRDIVSDMMKTIVLDKVIGKFGDDIEELYDQYAGKTIDEQDLMNKVAERTDALIKDYETNIPTLQNIVTNINGMLEEHGINLKNMESGSDTSASSRAYNTMSQDTGDEISGRLTAVNENQILQREQTAAISGSVLDIRNDILSIAENNVKLYDVAEESRQIMVNCYLELQEIRENTGTSAKILKSMSADMNTVKRKIETI